MSRRQDFAQHSTMASLLWLLMRGRGARVAQVAHQVELHGAVVQRKAVAAWERGEVTV